uniref:Uncharacterized protein n=1 Tax=uncultured bacterium A1Q1_fos_1060 TaxID=1256540 RepID=L7VX68_9BACT|nr:hypothetical protein [uncultured bacterium A1Q1_fos_1060]
MKRLDERLGKSSGIGHVKPIAPADSCRHDEEIWWILNHGARHRDEMGLVEKRVETNNRREFDVRATPSEGQS